MSTAGWRGRWALAHQPVRRKKVPAQQGKEGCLAGMYSTDLQARLGEGARQADRHVEKAK
jgi:hypothetical protein